MSLFSDVMSIGSEVVNSTLGSPCTYHHKDGSVSDNVYIVINKNNPVKNDYGMLAGYSVEANILRNDIPKVRNKEYFVNNETGEKWQVNIIEKETSTKWYVDIVKIK